MRDLRIETTAISEAAKKPFISIKINIRIISSNIRKIMRIICNGLIAKKYRIRPTGRQWKNIDKKQYAPLVMFTNRAIGIGYIKIEDLWLSLGFEKSFSYDLLKKLSSQNKFLTA
jgi:hypothetical protein